MGASNKKIAPVADSASDSTFHDLHILGRKLGRGSFAQVRIATHVKKDKPTEEIKDVAVKILDLRDSEIIKSLNLRDDARNEAKIWLRAARKNANVVQLHAVYYDPVCCYFVMEKCTSSLFDHLQSLPDMNERYLGKLITQMLFSISQIHSVGVVHRDVKPDNFLVGGDDGTTVKLCDFGLSAILPLDGKLKTGVGTAPFMCPEMLMGRSYNEKADVWSLGVVTYALLYGDFPYVPKRTSSNDMKKAILGGVAPTFQPVAVASGTYRSPTAHAFVQNLLERQPEDRPSATAALGKPYIVAVSSEQHLPAVTLPSLSAMIHLARQKGAFEIRNLEKTTITDDYLNNMQIQKQGIPMPVRRSEETSAFTKVRDSRESNTLSIPSSRRPVSLSSRATTASSGTSPRESFASTQVSISFK